MATTAGSSVAAHRAKAIPLPKHISAGIKDISKRDGWNGAADPEFALPSETWREHVARRQRCLDLREKLKSDDIHEINDLITLNLDIRQFAQDVVENCESKFFDDGASGEAILEIRSQALCDDDRLERHLADRPGYLFNPNTRKRPSRATAR